jgi:hypothetical protein
MSTENRLWGAPRIHGELLKLGIAVSERTVSRYLPDRTRDRSQTWRTFLTNHVGDLMCSSAVTLSEPLSNDDVVDADSFSLGLTPTPITAGRLHAHGADRLRAVGSTHVRSLAGFRVPTFAAERGQASSGRDPPSHCRRDWPNALYTRRFLRPAVPLRPSGTQGLTRLVRQMCWIALVQFGDSPFAASSK